ncbi:hypothetical protein H9Q70_002283 [Fusarium xylarioides]|nr:hypothetical protein H9Q70_002283 [Fusarium xylarioides]KAG5784406.1 hypothetical protein H9Q73_001929 [Fusarium xylarioides]
MTAPRRSKRIQALHQTEEGPQKITKSPEALNKDHPDKRRKTAGSQSEMPEGHAPKEHPVGDDRNEETPVTDPAVRRAELEKQCIEKRREEPEGKKRKVTESKECLHRMLALDRHDSDAIRYWNQLSGSIGSLVQQLDFKGIVWDTLDEAVQQKFISFAPNVEELFDVYGMPRCVFRRWVWEIIDENFFSKKSKDIIWTSPYWETQAAMEHYLQEHNFPYDDRIASYKYPHWRHTTMEFYMALEDSPGKPRRIDPTCVVPILSKALGRYFPEKRDGTLPIVLKHLEDEVAATEFYLDANLTFFSTVFHHPMTHQTCGFPYEPELEGIEGQAMDEIDESGKERLVDFVAEPMLQCRGFHDGYDYHVKTAQSPMKVCVAWLQDPNRPRLSEMARGVREQENEERDEEADGSKRADKQVDKEEEDEEEETENSVREMPKERAGKEVDKGEEEGDQTKQDEKKTNTKNTTKSKKKKKNKGKHRQQ